MYTISGCGYLDPDYIILHLDKMILIYLHFRFLNIQLSIYYQMHSVTFSFYQIFTILLAIRCFMKLTMSLYGRVKWSKKISKFTIELTLQHMDYY